GPRTLPDIPPDLPDPPDPPDYVSTILARVRRTIADYRLASPVTRVVAAVSGGSDSIALVHILHELDAAGDLRLVGLVHFNPPLRDPAGGHQSLLCAGA